MTNNYCILCEEYCLESTSEPYGSHPKAILLRCTNCGSYGYYAKDYEQLSKMHDQEKKILLAEAKEISKKAFTETPILNLGPNG